MNLLQKITVGMLLINFIVVAIFGYMLLWPVKFPVIYNEPFPVNKTEIRKGEHLTYTIEFEKFKNYAVDAHQNIICQDGNLVTLAPNKSNFPIGQHTIETTVVIPQKASFSTCYLELSVDYHINALRNENRVMRTQNFKIVP